MLKTAVVYQSRAECVSKNWFPNEQGGWEALRPLTSIMDSDRDVLQKRFRLNMSRIHGLIRIIFSDCDELKPSSLFIIEGTSADVLRASVVFLHSTFEDLLRCQIPRNKQDKKWVFYSGKDIDKALTSAGIDSLAFNPFTLC
jgi:hypothetical protein